MMLAGGAASSLLHPYAREYGDRSDMRSARAVLRRLYGRGADAETMLSAYMIDASAFVRRHRRQIERVADALLEHGTLSAARVRKALRGVSVAPAQGKLVRP